MQGDARLMLTILTARPQSVAELMRRTGFEEKRTRNAIDSLRNHEYCVWSDSNRRGFWVDAPVTRGIPSGSDRWKRLAS